MAAKPAFGIQATDGEHTIQLRKLKLHQLKRIDEFLEQLDGYGEVRLIVEKGELRFIDVVQSRRL